MESNISQVNILLRREIEALMAGPILEAFIRELGRDRVEELIRPVIASLAREGGRKLSLEAGGDTLAHLAAGLEAWSRGGALEIDLVERGQDVLAYNVTRCRYAEMYRRLGLADLGFLLSCERDAALVKGFNPRLKMERTKTIMEGQDCCDFRFTDPDCSSPPLC